MLTNRRQAWWRLLSGRRQTIPLYSRWTSDALWLDIIEPTLSDTYRRNADFNFKSSQEGHRDAIRQDTNKLSVETPEKDSTYSVHSLVKAQDKTLANQGRASQRLLYRCRLKMPSVPNMSPGSHRKRRWKTDVERHDASRRDADSEQKPSQEKPREAT
jgi:hypothetical protein